MAQAAAIILPVATHFISDSPLVVCDNQAFIPNYGDSYRHDEIISTSFVESTVKYVVSKRIVKKQQMRWTQRGAHLLLQTRVQLLIYDLRKTFIR